MLGVAGSERPLGSIVDIGPLRALRMSAIPRNAHKWVFFTEIRPIGRRQVVEWLTAPAGVILGHAPLLVMIGDVEGIGPAPGAAME